MIPRPKLRMACAALHKMTQRLLRVLEDERVAAGGSRSWTPHRFVQYANEMWEQRTDIPILPCAIQRKDLASTVQPQRWWCVGCGLLGRNLIGFNFLSMLADRSGQLTQLQHSLTLIQQSVSVSVVAFSLWVPFLIVNRFRTQREPDHFPAVWLVPDPIQSWRTWPSLRLVCFWVTLRLRLR